MSKQRKTVASTYLYDPLDRLAASNSIQRFYNDTRIATEIEGERKSRFFETDSHPLALQQHGSLPGTTLLATDQQTSVLNGISPEGALHAQAYSPFGHHPIGTSLNGAGFNGEQPEPLTGHYLLGQGYRAFNPVLMRFNSPDSWSPFGDGGINAYAYCDNDPLNKTDPTGHLPIISFLKKTPAWTTREISRNPVNIRRLSRSPSRHSSTSQLSSAGEQLSGNVSPGLSRQDSTTSRTSRTSRTSISSINSDNGAAVPQTYLRQRRPGVHLQQGDAELIEVQNRFGGTHVSQGAPELDRTDTLPTYKEATSPPSYFSAFNDATNKEKKFYFTQKKRDDIRK
ncbi:RHS repeat-associated core domain-containing protein [Pseudomonas helleri]|uniref:RHS repeat-associated core domain-containing protein n=1 Tax=Pseudomonas helleri TaxID=1608996 RepID=A0A6L5I032_9PSED|nr:RHS repeat-associated core domain-containing protein [Pseudomonas helleri]MQU08045.1 hypothetical protein [Pseudomonas helleri]